MPEIIETAPHVAQIRRVLNKLGPVIGLLLILVVFGVLEPNKFLSARNIANVAGQTVVVATAAVGMTFVIIAGGIDLSVGSLIALAGVVGTLAMVCDFGRAELRGETAGPVQFRQESTLATKPPALTNLPHATVIVTDDESGTRDLSNSLDLDKKTERKLVVRWNVADTDYKYFHVYVKNTNGRYKRLGRTRDGTGDHLLWRKNAPGIGREFSPGPEFGNAYQFKVYGIRKSGAGSIAVGVVAATITGLLCGLFNGAVITLALLPPFIVTLGTLEIFRGTALQITNGLPVTNLPRAFEKLAMVPYSVYFLIALGIVAWLILRYTVFGVAVYALGSNERTARLCGIRVNRVKCAVYMIGGLTAGLAGILQASRLITGQPTTATGLELDVIAAVVIGGGSLLGGEGTILGSIVGALIMGFLRNGCNVVGISPFVQRIIIGAIIILAVLADQIRHRPGLFRRRRRSARET